MHLAVITLTPAQLRAGDANPECLLPAAQLPLKPRCCICLEDFAEEQQLRILPCFHRYHQDCIDEWLGRSDECPLCKFRITTDETWTCRLERFQRGSSSIQEASSIAASPILQCASSLRCPTQASMSEDVGNVHCQARLFYHPAHVNAVTISQDTSFLDSVEVSSHGSATPGLATIDSGSEETDESASRRQKF
ncbi:RNF43 [Symbiodinium natans]|uniref:RNF43 protein n=1 Tax=Symbiodinium natans TaxID=878477 RepID=A0A812U7X6_9DINO|nr:RNF43 [Symbiodinium natans]